MSFNIWRGLSKSPTTNGYGHHSYFATILLVVVLGNLNLVFLNIGDISQILCSEDRTASCGVLTYSY